MFFSGLNFNCQIFQSSALKFPPKLPSKALIFPVCNPSAVVLSPISLNKGIITDNQGQTFVKFSSEQFSKLFASHEREREKAG